MNTTTQPLADNPVWQKLLLSAEGSIGKNWSVYEDPEPRLFGRLADDYGGDMDALAGQALLLLQEVSKNQNSGDNDWAVLKESASLLYHLHETGYKPEDDWEHAIDVLWKALGEFAQGSWSAFVPSQGNEVRPRAWKEQKFVLDAILTALYKLPAKDEDRAERFFNCKMSKYWKAFVLFWEEIWGKQLIKDWEPYFQAWDYRANQKQTTYRLLCYRLLNYESEFPAHPNKPREAFDFLKDNSELIPAEKKLRKEIFHALFQYLRGAGEEHSLEQGLATIKTILGEDDVFEFLVHYETSDRALRGGMLLMGFKEGLNTRWKANIKHQYQMLPDLMAALKHDELDVRERAANFLIEYPTELFKHLRYVENMEREEKTEASNETFKLIARIFGKETAKLLLENISFTPLQKGKFLLATPRILEELWEAKEPPNHDTLLPVILAAVEDGGPSVQESASNFLKRKSADIQRKLDILIRDLQDEDKASEMIVSAIEFGSDAALKTILGKCVNWVASGQNTTLVDRAAQKARNTPDAVLALINLLNNRQDFQKNEEVKKYVRRRVLEDQQNPTILRVFHDDKLSDSELDNHTAEEIYKWCYSQKEQSKAYADLVSSQEEALRKKDGSLSPHAVFGLARAILKLREQDEMKARELVVQKWITQLLSEMSDRWFFEDKMDTYNNIRMQLERLAIEPLSKRLPQEENLDIRENLVKILGNIGGRVAVDALVRTVTGEERERAARQELLSEYYLKPSKARSEEASILLNDAVDNAKKTMRLLQQLNVATFAMGVILIIGGVAISVVSEELGGRITGVLAGLGGLAAILTQFLKDPLERIQRAMADLVQVQTAFTSFVWELNLNGTYIQSQYVSEGILTDFDLRQTIGRIDHAMERTMHLIQVYADGQNLQQPPQLHYLVQNADTVTLFGQSLKRSNGRSEKDKFQLAINHQPIDTQIETWTDQMVMFSLDKGLAGKYNGSPRLWVSLLLNGNETNALPFTIEHSTKDKTEKKPVETPAETAKE